MATNPEPDTVAVRHSDAEPAVPRAQPEGHISGRLLARPVLLPIVIGIVPQVLVLMAK